MKARKSGLKYIFAIMALLFVTTIFNINKQMIQIKNLETELDEKNQELEEIKSNISSLNEEIKDSDSLSFIEKIARDEYGMVKPKEIIFIDKNKIDSENP